MKSCGIQIRIKKAFRFIFFSGLLFGTVIGIEIIYFNQILSKSDSPGKADIIIVFDGGSGRIEAGYDLAVSGYAPYLVISSANMNKLDDYAGKHKLPSTVKHIIEDKARTTFENALYTSRIIKKHNFDSVILVTSSYHLPRSCFLLRMMLSGYNVEVKTFGVAEDSTDLPYSVGWKGMYNEMIELWGSILELLFYRIRGHLPDQKMGDVPIVKSMKSLFLFEQKI